MSGEIRCTVKYLVQLLETKEFKKNTIDTSWLDVIIKAKLVSLEVPNRLVVMSATILKAVQH